MEIYFLAGCCCLPKSEKNCPAQLKHAPQGSLLIIFIVRMYYNTGALMLFWGGCVSLIWWHLVLLAAGQKLGAAGVIVDTFPLHNPDKLKDLSEAWYTSNQLAQPLGTSVWINTRNKQINQIWWQKCGINTTNSFLLVFLDKVNEYFGSSMAFYFSFLDFYTWSLLPPAILGLFIAYYSSRFKSYLLIFCLYDEIQQILLFTKGKTEPKILLIEHLIM